MRIKKKAESQEINHRNKSNIKNRSSLQEKKSLKLFDEGEDIFHPAEETGNKPSSKEEQNERSKKTFRHYVFDFAMLFLAVYGGFVADNIREQVVENHRENEFMHIMLQDLKMDTTDLQSNISFRRQKGNKLDSLFHLLNTKKIHLEGNALYRLSTGLTSYNRFKYSDRTIQQLKAGYQRIIRNTEVSNAIIEYDSYVQFRQNVSFLEINYQTTYYNSIGNIFDPDVLEDMYHYRDSILTHKTQYNYDKAELRRFPNQNPELRSYENEKINALKNTIFNAKRINANYINDLMDIYIRAKSLMQFIQKEYKIEGKVE